MRKIFRFNRKNKKTPDHKTVEQWRNAGWSRTCKYRAFSDSLVKPKKGVRFDRFYGEVVLENLRSTIYSLTYKLSGGKNKVLVDAGCGRSPDAKIAVEQDGFKKSYQIDLFPFPVAKGNIVHMEQDYCEKWKGIPDNSIDLVIAQATLDLVDAPDRDLFYKNAAKALKKGGYLGVYIVNLVGGHGFSTKEEKEAVSNQGFYVEKSVTGGFIAIKK